MRESTDQLDKPNRQVNNTSKTTYSRVGLLNIRRRYRCSVNPSALQSFTLFGILRYKGSRGGCRWRIPVRISNRRDETSSWNADSRPVNDMARANLVPIARQVEPTTNKSSSEFAVRKSYLQIFAALPRLRTEFEPLSHWRRIWIAKTLISVLFLRPILSQKCRTLLLTHPATAYLDEMGTGRAWIADVKVEWLYLQGVTWT